MGASERTNEISNRLKRSTNNKKKTIRVKHEEQNKKIKSRREQEAERSEVARGERRRTFSINYYNLPNRSSSSSSSFDTARLLKKNQDDGFLVLKVDEYDNSIRRRRQQETRSKWFEQAGKYDPGRSRNDLAKSGLFGKRRRPRCRPLLRATHTHTHSH